MSSELKLLWHEASNVLAIADLHAGLPLLTVLDDEYKGINPFYSYPFVWLIKHWGWIELGEL